MVKVVTAETSEEGSTEHMSSSSKCVLLEGHVEYMFLTYLSTLPYLRYLTSKGISNGMWRGE